MKPNSIFLDGSEEQQRYVIHIDHIRLSVTRISMRILSILAIELITNKDSDGWVNKDNIYNVRPRLSINRLIKSIQKHPAFKDWKVIEARGRTGHYRLVADANTIQLNRDRIRSLGFHDIVEKLDKHIEGVNPM